MYNKYGRIANKDIYHKENKMDNTLKQIQKILDQACDKQRKASNLPEIPVVSALDIEDKDALNDKLDACDTNYCFFLKDQEDDCMSCANHSSFYADDEDEIENMIQEDLFSEIASKVIAKWLENAAEGDKIIIRKSMPASVTGKVARLVNNETVVQDTDEYLLVLVATDRLFEFMKAFPV